MQTHDLQSSLSVSSTMIHNIYVMASNAHTFYHTTRRHSVYPINSDSYLFTSTHYIVPCTKPHATFIPSSLSTWHSSVYLTANNTHTFFSQHTVLFCVPDGEQCSYLLTSQHGILLCTRQLGMLIPFTSPHGTVRCIKISRRNTNEETARG